VVPANLLDAIRSDRSRQDRGLPLGVRSEERTKRTEPVRLTNHVKSQRGPLFGSHTEWMAAGAASVSFARDHNPMDL